MLRSARLASLPPLLLTAARRFAVIFVASAAAIVLISLAAGALLGSPASRSVPLGLYVSGCAIMIIGFLYGLRGPVRPADNSVFSVVIPFLGGMGARRATPEEHRETLNMSGVYVVLGVALLALAVVVDSRYRLI